MFYYDVFEVFVSILEELGQLNQQYFYLWEFIHEQFSAGFSKKDVNPDIDVEKLTLPLRSSEPIVLIQTMKFFRPLARFNSVPEHVN